MNLLPTPDLSVYQLALDYLVPSQSLRVSPTILKSLVGAVIDILIEQKIPATLWVKLPPIEGWQTELTRYQQADVPYRIYLCSCFGDDLVEGFNVIGQAGDVNPDAQIIPVQLAPNCQLKQESFVIILCEPFSTLIVASEPEPKASVTLRSSQPLVAVCTFEQQVIQRVMEGIREVIAVADTTPDKLLHDWETLFPSLPASDEKALLTQLLVKQIQRTEEIFQQPMTSESFLSSSAVPNNPVDAPDVVNALLTSTKNAATAIPLPPNDDLRKKDELLKRVAQELRTPLTNMKTALKLLDSAQLKPAQRQRYMQLLNTECDRQNTLLVGLLELVQLDSDPQPTIMPSVQLIEIVPGVVSTYQPLAQEKGIQLGYTIPAGLPSVSCLETWLRQIVINLLHNSLKFTPAGGQVRVRVTVQGEYVQLTFCDTGIGIATAEIPKIFDSFYRGRPTQGEETGAGLGLTIVQQLLRRCGGSISVTSRLGEGSNFKVLLPVTSSTPTAIDTLTN
jgi:signal transduction histidine kinase